MAKKQQLTEAEIHTLIVKEAKYRLGCTDFKPEFTLRPIEPPGYATPVPGLAPPISGTRVTVNWEVQSARNVETWPPDCAEAFQEAVARARRKFDIAWPR